MWYYNIIISIGTIQNKYKNKKLNCKKKCRWAVEFLNIFYYIIKLIFHIEVLEVQLLFFEFFTFKFWFPNVKTDLLKRSK